MLDLTVHENSQLLIVRVILILKYHVLICFIYVTKFKQTATLHILPDVYYGKLLV